MCLQTLLFAKFFFRFLAFNLEHKSQIWHVLYVIITHFTVGCKVLKMSNVIDLRVLVAFLSPLLRHWMNLNSDLKFECFDLFHTKMAILFESRIRYNRIRDTCFCVMTLSMPLADT